MTTRNDTLVRAIARLFLGLVFVYLGATKAADPVSFLKLVREFHVVETAPMLNAIAAVVPWFELFCGAALLLGVKVRAVACVQALLLAGFTALVALRGIAVHRATGVPFCGIRFDCGCGTGEVFVCLKLIENVALLALACFVARSGPHALQAHAPL